jgi:hypothetical protein
LGPFCTIRPVWPDMSALGNLAKSEAGAYAFLGIVVIVGFVVIHSALRKDVSDVADAAKHPFGQGFDDAVQGFFDRIFGSTPDTTENSDAPPSTFPIDPDFGLKNPAQGF